MEQWRDHSGLRSAEIVDGRLRLVLDNTLAAVEDGRSEIMRFLGPLDAMAQNRLEVLFEELVSNTIRHGFAKDSGQSIHVQVERGPDASRLIFEDDGLPFDPTQAELPEGFTSAETARIGGLGHSPDRQAVERAALRRTIFARTSARLSSPQQDHRVRRTLFKARRRKRTRKAAPALFLASAASVMALASCVKIAGRGDRLGEIVQPLPQRLGLDGVVLAQLVGVLAGRGGQEPGLFDIGERGDLSPDSLRVGVQRVERLAPGRDIEGQSPSCGVLEGGEIRQVKAVSDQ